MSSRKTRLAGAAAAVALAGGAAAAGLATSASAATVTAKPAVVHRACAYNLNGGNILDLNLNGTDYQYPVLLHVGPNGLVLGLLHDKNLPAGHQNLVVHGLCVGDNAILGVNYPGGQTEQGSRVENMLLSPVPGHPFRATVGGVWDETGALAESGTASFVFQVHR